MFSINKKKQKKRKVSKMEKRKKEVLKFGFEIERENILPEIQNTLVNYNYKNAKENLIKSDGSLSDNGGEFVTKCFAVSSLCGQDRMFNSLVNNQLLKLFFHQGYAGETCGLHIHQGYAGETCGLHIHFTDGVLGKKVGILRCFAVLVYKIKAG